MFFKTYFFKFVSALCQHLLKARAPDKRLKLFLSASKIAERLEPLSTGFDPPLILCCQSVDATLTKYCSFSGFRRGCPQICAEWRKFSCLHFFIWRESGHPSAFGEHQLSWSSCAAAKIFFCCCCCFLSLSLSLFISLSLSPLTSSLLALNGARNGKRASVMDAP
jgi:hypothetical protein